MPQTIAKSARYPRVAVLLGVKQHYYVPLLVCRSFSTIFTFIWAVQACKQIYTLTKQNAEPEDAIVDRSTTNERIFNHRLRVVQVALAFIWVRHYTSQ